MRKTSILSLTAALALGSSVAFAAGYDLQITNNSLEAKPFVLNSPGLFGNSLIINPGVVKNFSSTLNPAKLPIAGGTLIGTTTWPTSGKTSTCKYTAPSGGIGAQMSVSQLARSCTVSF